MKNEQGLKIIGLGGGSVSDLCRAAWDQLSRASEIYVCSKEWIPSELLPANLPVQSLIGVKLLQDGEEDERLAHRLVELAARPGGVVYAAAGSPLPTDAVAARAVDLAKASDLPVDITPGLSLIDQALAALTDGKFYTPGDHITLASAAGFAGAHHPQFPPSYPALITGVRPVNCEKVRNALLGLYSSSYPVKLVTMLPGEQLKITDGTVESLCGYEHSTHAWFSAVFVPALSPDTSFESFQETIAHLRAPEGCPWDREQTHQTLRTNLLGEAYEVLEALDAADPAAMREELGDLLLQIVLHAQIGHEYGEFNMADIIQGIQQKLIRRHPHVFGDVTVRDAGHVIQNWEKIKEQERHENGQDTEKGLLDGVPLALPALSQAQEIQARAARVGFDWSEVDPVIAKVREELDEVLSASPDKRGGEIGDLLFAVVNLARWYEKDAESMLRETNNKFRRRFRHVENQARQTGRRLSEMTLAEMDVFWDEAKSLE